MKFILLFIILGVHSYEYELECGRTFIKIFMNGKKLEHGEPVAVHKSTQYKRESCDVEYNEKKWVNKIYHNVNFL